VAIGIWPGKTTRAVMVPMRVLVSIRIPRPDLNVPLLVVPMGTSDTLTVREGSAELPWPTVVMGYCK